MYTQFFGTYLLSDGYVTPEQLFSAMQRQTKEHIKLGTLAIHAGHMTADQVDKTVIEQTHQGRKFGELAIELGYLTEEQVSELLSHQTPSYLMIGQALLDDGILTNTSFEQILNEYHDKNGIEDPQIPIETTGSVRKLFEHFYSAVETPVTHNGDIYIELLLNDLIRFIGADFSPLTIETVQDFPVKCCVKQSILGAYSANTYIAMDEQTAIAFASRYVKYSFNEYDEYVQASLEDFLNLQNGLFTVNVSNDSSTELTLVPPEQITDDKLSFSVSTGHIPILYPFGELHFFIELLQSPEA